MVASLRMAEEAHCYDEARFHRVNVAAFTSNGLRDVTRSGCHELFFFLEMESVTY
jgi:hypothetical protein